jgi:hypothetical protein
MGRNFKLKGGYKQYMKKWEKKEREKMGDSKFLEKYIRMYSKIDKANRFLFPFAVCVCLLFAVWRCIVCYFYLTFGNLLFAAISFALTLTWFLLTTLYYSYLSYGIYRQHIERWKAEAKKTNN